MNNRMILLCALIAGLYPSIHAKTIFLFAHGIADTYKQAYRYVKNYHINGTNHHNQQYLFAAPFATFNFPDASEGIKRINHHETSLAQDNEILRLKKAYYKTMSVYEDQHQTPCEVVLFGLSRGASAAINFVGLHNPSNIKALILESPYDSVATIIDFMMQKMHLTWLPHSCGEYMMENIFRRYKRDGIHSIDLVDRINKNIPILIICSKEDQRVPWYSSAKLYQQLCKSGHKHVYLYIADHGKHSKILWDQNGKTYQSIVHAFCRTHGLPHDPTLAENGQNQLNLCQPVLKKV